VREYFEFMKEKVSACEWRRCKKVE